MDLNMPIKHNEMNANVKAQTLCLGISKGLKLYPQSVVRTQWEELGPGKVRLAHCNLIHDKTSRTEFSHIQVGFQGVQMG